VINSRTEVDLFEAMRMLDLSSEELLVKMAEERKLKSRRAGGSLYFLREEVEALVVRQIEEARSSEGNAQSEGGNE